MEQSVAIIALLLTLWTGWLLGLISYRSVMRFLEKFQTKEPTEAMVAGALRRAFEIDNESTE